MNRLKSHSNHHVHRLRDKKIVSTNSNTELVTGVAILKIMSRIFSFKVKTNVRKKKENDCKVIISGKKVYKNLYPKKGT